MNEHLKPLVTGLFVQQFVQLNNKKYQYYWPRIRGIHLQHGWLHCVYNVLNGWENVSDIITQQPSLTLIQTCISNYIHYKVWDEITYPFPNFNSATIAVEN